MYKKILCAIDISPEGEAILSKAVSVAKQYDSELFLVHVIEYTFLPQDYQKKFKEEAIPKITEMAEKFGINRKHSYIKFGQSYSQICELEQGIGIDLIVVGSHGKYGIKALLGSTASGVLQQAQCDVLLVKVH